DTTIPTETPTPTITATPTNTVRADLPEGLAVGFAKRDISPNLQVAPPDGQVYLGGYGFGPGRRSNGILMPIYVRAMVISDGERVTAFAETETQGMFAKYRPNLGDVGLVDIGIAIEEATGGRISREAVMIGSDHSHSGPDAIGVWGGVRNTYLAHLRAQAIAAILDAFNKMQPAQLKVGTAEASALLTSQFDEPPNDVTDGELRVLAAVERDNPERIFGVMINYAAHSTVMGSDNRLVSGDWPSVVSANLEEQLQIDTALVMLADCGRTQPRRGDFGGEDQYQALENYGAAVTERVNQALTNAVPAQTGAIASSQRFIRERYDNDFLSLQLLSAVVLRNLLPPWGDGEIVGTLVSAVRVGELLFTAIPGEGYPEIQFKMEQQVPAQEHFIFGLANDQLGYLIAPLEGFPQIHAAAPGNDNAVFNISPEIGDHVMCTLLKSARDIGFDLPADPDKCETWGSEDNELPY
ncbi:MAG TPA: neutral/alkaline non-lysosomal ceramidase N-terminal domain-containing protein, partial [Terriglobales bacterium]|nr:neutral/alkaline non-lysosomal ceramidase N-terminal domain-containing protein [Terriglobales bacterium]